MGDCPGEGECMLNLIKRVLLAESAIVVLNQVPVSVQKSLGIN
jgi:hypothetical protein